VTAGDFAAGRFGSKGLELAIAITGILATMPYIALQLVGMEKVIQALGFQGGDGLLAHLPLTIAFVILALYTYTSGLRAPALLRDDNRTQNLKRTLGTIANARKRPQGNWQRLLEPDRLRVLVGPSSVEAVQRWHQSFRKASAKRVMFPRRA